MGNVGSTPIDKAQLAKDTEVASERASSNDDELHKSNSAIHRIKKEFKVRRSVLSKYVDKILEDSEINIEWIPDKLERKIYEFAIMEAMKEAYAELFKYHGREVCGHHFELELIRCDDIPLPPKGGINKDNLNIIVDKLMASDLIQISWLPHSIKRQLFFNILLLILTVMQITCTSSKCDILGHRIAATFAAKAERLERSNVERSIIDPNCLKKFIDDHLADPEKNVPWLPDYVEASLLTTISVLVLTLIEEVFHDFRVNLMSEQVRFHLVPGPAPSLEDLVDMGDIKENMGAIEKEREKYVKKIQKLDDIISRITGEKPKDSPATVTVITKESGTSKTVTRQPLMSNLSFTLLVFVSASQAFFLYNHFCGNRSLVQ
jgi:hypothetical protein